MGSNLAERLDDQEKESTVEEHIKNLVIKSKPKFEQLLAGNINIDKFLGVALRELRANPKLAQCDVASFMGAVAASAQLGLEPGGPLGHAYLVPYKGKVTLQIGYKGMEQLAYRSGLVSSINAHVVREGDDFAFEYGTNAFIRHVPKAGVGGKVTHAYCVASLVTGGKAMAVLFLGDIERRRDASASYKGNPKNSPWTTDFDEMARKSAIRALFRDLPASTETQRALGYDERVVTPAEVDDEQFDGDVIDVDEISEGS